MFAHDFCQSIQSLCTLDKTFYAKQVRVTTYNHDDGLCSMQTQKQSQWTRNLFPLHECRTNSRSVSGTSFCTNTCWSSRSPNGPEQVTAHTDNTDNICKNLSTVKDASICLLSNQQTERQTDQYIFIVV